jgi:hypothetical protein
LRNLDDSADPAMTILFGSLGDGRTVRAFAAVAGIVSVGAIAIGAETDRYAQAHRAGLSVTSILKPEVVGLSQPSLAAVDYARTGSFDPGDRRELTALGSCRDALGKH